MSHGRNWSVRDWVNRPQVSNFVQFGGDHSVFISDRRRHQRIATDGSMTPLDKFVGYYNAHDFNSLQDCVNQIIADGVVYAAVELPSGYSPNVFPQVTINPASQVHITFMSANRLGAEQFLNVGFTLTGTTSTPCSVSFVGIGLGQQILINQTLNSASGWTIRGYNAAFRGIDATGGVTPVNFSAGRVSVVAFNSTFYPSGANGVVWDSTGAAARRDFDLRFYNCVFVGNGNPLFTCKGLARSQMECHDCSGSSGAAASATNIIFDVSGFWGTFAVTGWRITFDQGSLFLRSGSAGSDRIEELFIENCFDANTGGVPLPAGAHFIEIGNFSSAVISGNSCVVHNGFVRTIGNNNQIVISGNVLRGMRGSVASGSLIDIGAAATRAAITGNVASPGGAGYANGVTAPAGNQVAATGNNFQAATFAPTALLSNVGNV